MNKNIIALAMAGGIVVIPAGIAIAGQSDPVPEGKAAVCKYVGKPFVNERLQTGNNPIVVSLNAIKKGPHDPAWVVIHDPIRVGDAFADAQGRSIVIGLAGYIPNIADCPGYVPPTSTTTTTTEVPSSTSTTHTTTSTTSTTSVPSTTTFPTTSTTPSQTQSSTSSSSSTSSTPATTVPTETSLTTKPSDTTTTAPSIVRSKPTSTPLSPVATSEELLAHTGVKTELGILGALLLLSGILVTKMRNKLKLVRVGKH